jgi:hypothetical protein
MSDDDGGETKASRKDERLKVVSKLHQELVDEIKRICRGESE